MKHPPRTHAPRRRVLRPIGAALAIPESAPAPGDDAGFVEHPDGWYWLAADGHQQFGPFATLSLARADRDRPESDPVNEAEAEREAAEDLGVQQAIHADALDEPGPGDARG